MAGPWVRTAPSSPRQTVERHGTVQASGFELTIRGVDFIDTRTGWAVGHLGLILHTGDGGQTWSVQGHESALGLNLIRVRFSGPDTGRIITEQGGFTLGTTDGGATWDRQFFASTQLRSDAFILDDTHSWVALSSGGVLSTTDSGASWKQHKGINQVQIGTTGIFFLDERRGWIAGWRGKQQGITSGVQFVKYLTDGMVAYTTDGGQTWTRVDADSGKFLWDVVFVDAQEGWAVGSFRSDHALHRRRPNMVPRAPCDRLDSQSGDLLRPQHRLGSRRKRHNPQAVPLVTRRRPTRDGLSQTFRRL